MLRMAGAAALGEGGQPDQRTAGQEGYGHRTEDRQGEREFQ
jgi:hypothetical protein